MIGSFWLFFLAGDLVGVDTTAGHSLMRRIVSEHPLGSLIGFTIATIVSMIPALFLGLAAAFSFRRRSVAFVLGYLSFANIFAITLCTILIAGMIRDATLKKFIVANGLESTNLWHWLFHYHTLLHGTWILAVSSGFGVGLIAYAVISRFEASLSH